MDNGREFHFRPFKRGWQQHGIRIDHRPPATPRFLASPVLYEPVTPAALSSRFAFGALAIVAAVLDSLEAPGKAGHTWEQDGVPPAMNAASFLLWPNDDGRNRHRIKSRHWDRQVNAAFRAACAGMQGATERKHRISRAWA